MKRVYKLTDENMRTYGNCEWKLGEEKTTSGKGELCTSGWLHCYSDPILAVMLNPFHANFSKPRLFKAKVRGRGKHDRGLKSGYAAMTLVEEIPVPTVSTEQRIRFAILCAKEVYKEPSWNKWADDWLSRKNRTNAAYAAAAYAAAAYAAAAYAANAAAAATNAAANANAAAAAYAAANAAADDAAKAAAAYAADTAANAADTAANAQYDLDLISLAHKAMEEV